MVRAPNWAESEFKTLLYSPQLSDEELSRRLQRRTPGAIGVVREGIHAWHKRKENPGRILSKMMLNMLQKRQHPITCHKCSKEFGKQLESGSQETK